VAQDELGDAKLAQESPAANMLDPREILSSLMKEKGVSLDSIKTKLTKEKSKGAEKIQSVDDIPKPKCFELIARLKKAKLKKV
jgi:hypothetical protein